MPPLLTMKSIRKSFAGVEVLHGVDLELHAGEVVALVGENGAGKSTLIRILGGVYSDHAGEIRLGGEPVRFRHPRAARAAGVQLLHQELSLVAAMTVAENIALGREPTGRFGVLDRRALLAAARRALEPVDPAIDPERPVESLPAAAQQLVELAKALAGEARILVMDEPTSSLGQADVAHLFALIRRLRASGVGILYISHKLEEVYAVADRITVLRDGALVGTALVAELPPERLIQWMVGRRIEQLFPRTVAQPGAELLRLRDWTLRDAEGARPVFEGIDLELRAGEVVGLAGLRGAGTSALLGSVFGRFGRRPTGRLWLQGREGAPASPAEAIARGMALVTSDRKDSGLVLPLSVLHNITLASLDRIVSRGLLSARLERRAVAAALAALELRGPSLDAPVETLSGGNQQKVILARWLLTRADVLALDEPTRGIDVGAKAEIYRLLDRWTAERKGILLITSELPELLGLSDRILVLHRGRLRAAFTRAEATQAKIAAAMTTSAPAEVAHA
ncbi:MAG: sugar ABC transporter ATP-binding protein [Planctomycetes bacterium]|nr:sugar ABC transporter ATP-binding protein [Planctomycetota bacterium]